MKGLLPTKAFLPLTMTHSYIWVNKMRTQITIVI